MASPYHGTVARPVSPPTATPSATPQIPSLPDYDSVLLQLDAEAQDVATQLTEARQLLEVSCVPFQEPSVVADPLPLLSSFRELRGHKENFSVYIY